MVEFLARDFVRLCQPRLARAATVLLLAVSLGACSSLFGKDETPPDEPADRLYNEGLYLLNQKKAPKEAVTKLKK